MADNVKPFSIPRKDLLNRYGQLRRERDTWRPLWIELTNYYLPYNGRYWRQDRDRGWRRTGNIFDNTATKAVNTLAAGMMSGMTSPARPWFRFGTPDPDLSKSKNVREWCDLVARVILDIFQKGNTYRMLHGIYQELGVFGTSAALILDDYKDVMRGYNLTTGEFCIAQNWRGDVCTVYREFEKTVGEIVGEFGRDKVSNTVRALYDRGNLEAWVPLLHAIEPRADRDPSKLDSLNMEWGSHYLEIGADSETVLRESGYDYFPAVSPRWNIVGSDIYGNSPGIISLGDVKQLQQEQLRKGQAIDYMTKPPLQLPSGMKNREIDAMPGGISYLDTTEKPGARNLFQVQLDVQHLLLDIQDVRDRINSSFYSDLFLMMANDTRSGITATEVAERQEEKLLMLGPVLERLNNELLSPLVETAFKRALQAGLVPPAPPELHGQDLNIEYISMLAQAQRAVATTSVDRFVQSMGMVAQLKPEVLDNFDPDEWASVYSDSLGVPPQMLVASDKIALLRQQRAQQQEQQAKMAAQAQQAQTAQTASQTPTANGSNLLNDVMSNYTGYGAPQQVGAVPANQ